MTTHEEAQGLIKNILDLEKAIKQESDSNYILHKNIKAHRHQLQMDILSHRDIHKDQMAEPYKIITELKAELHRQHSEALSIRLESLTSV